MYTQMTSTSFSTKRSLSKIVLFLFPVPHYPASQSQHYKVQADTALFADKKFTKYGLKMWLYATELLSAVLPSQPTESYEVDLNKRHSLHP
jgi:hypothetical protein